MNDQIKKDNRKNLPRFLIMIFGCMLIGGVVGYFSAATADSDAPDNLVVLLNQFLADYLPVLFGAIALILMAASAVLIRQSKKLFAGWDGEDEDLPDKIDQKLNFSLLLLSVLMVFSFFAFSAATVLCSPYAAFFVLAEFVLVLFVSTLLQKSTVDLTRSLNPEKKGSIFDMKFQKTWLDSCDENERRQIGEAGFAAFKAVNTTCIILWMLLLAAHLIFDAGLLSSFVVLLIWGVLQVSYIWTCMKLSRKK